jgi:signal transduction histidine kinase/CheY-like chemotaxis protein
MNRFFGEKQPKILIPALYVAAMLLVVIYVWNSQTTVRRARTHGLFRNLMEYPAYVRRGFDPLEIHSVPGEGWYRFASPPLRIMDSPLPDLPKRPYLSPFGRDAEEFTIVIALEMDDEAMTALNRESADSPAAKPLVVPGLFFALIGDNWEIYLNGALVRSEMHLNGEGKIRSHRSWRDVYFPVPASLLVPGTNILALRIIGDPAFDCTGLYYNAPYYLDDYRNIEKRHQPFLLVALCGLFTFAGIYHLMLFLSLKKRGELFNLCFSVLSFVLCIYTIARNGIVNSLIPNSDISVRLEYICIFTMSSLIGVFFEFFDRRKTTIVARVYFGFCLFLSLSQALFCTQYGDDVLKIWNISALIYFTYVVFYNVTCFLLKNRKTGAGNQDRAMTHIVVGVVAVYLCGIYDLLDAVFFHMSFSLFQYSFFVVTLGIAFTLVSRFSRLYNRLDETNATLETAVHERTAELEKQTEIAVNASRAKSEFLATMSHEIRTPLNAVIGLSEIELRGDLPAASKNNIEQIYQSGSSLLTIINDILDISKIEAGSFELVPEVYETASFINDTIRLNMVRIGSKPIDFALEAGADFPRKLLGDELRVKQILNNILSNAIKYTQKGNVSLSAAWEKRGSEALLRFTVRDTGMGIRREDLGKLFSDYTQLDARANRKIEGTGLGLAITKKLVEMMGGGVTVESEYGKGSVFTVEIVQGIADEEPIGAETAENLRTFRYTSTGKNRNLKRSWMPYGNVLIVDDMPVNLQVARGLLEPYGLRIDTALSGRGAVNKVRAEAPRYDVIFMDHMMPEMDGVEAVRIIRQEIDTEYSRNVPIIALTANALSGMKEMFLEKGFNGFVSKPIDVVQLDEALNIWVRDRQSEETLRQAEAGERRQEEQKKEPMENAEGLTIPGVDVNLGIEMTGGTGTGYRKVLTVFHRDTEERLDFLRNFAAAGAAAKPDALSAFTTQVHALKGAAATIGAADVSSEAARLESAGRAGDMDFIREHLPGFTEHLAALAKGIEQALNREKKSDEFQGQQPSSVSGAAPPDGAILNLLHRLAEALQTKKAGSIDRILEELDRQNPDAETKEALEKISDDVLLVEFNAALETVNDVLGRLNETRGGEASSP